jgi:glucose-1-phosphate thymidylyltransferase
MTKIVEKPSTPISKLANIGLYYVRDVEALFAGIDHVLASPANKGEYYLTDAFQHMIDHHRKILTAEVGGWYDCGQLETTLETNGILLQHGAARHPAVGPDVRLVPPVLIEDGCTLERCTIGPNVSLERGCTVRDAAISQAIIGANCVIERSTLTHAMLGDGVRVTDFTGSGTLGSHAEVMGRA